jgi:hypothetical protein
MNTRQAIELLYVYGHFHHPAMPNGWNVGPAVFDLLKPDDRAVRDAVASFQDFNGLSVTGDLGPATLELLGAERCAVPDYPDPTAAVGTGSWPQPCQKGGVKFNVDLSRCPQPDQVEELLAGCMKAYADVGVRLVRVEPSAGANINVLWQVLAGSTIGLAEYNGESCGDNVFCKLDPGYWPNLRQVQCLLLHEWGHNMNLQHTRGGIMNPSIISVDEFNGWQTFRDDPSVPVLRRYFGGEPLDPVTPPPPPPPTPGPGPIIPVGEFTLAESLSPGKYKIVREVPTLPPGPNPFPA